MDEESTDCSRKEKIINAARKLFVANGFNGTSMRDIAKESQVQTSLIYHYFENKTCLWKHVKTSFIRSADFAIKENLEHSDTLKSFITELVTERFAYYNENLDVLRMYHWQRLEKESAPLLGFAGNIGDSFWDKLVDKIEEFQASGQIKVKVPAE